MAAPDSGTSPSAAAAAAVNSVPHGGPGGDDAAATSATSSVGPSASGAAAADAAASAPAASSSGCACATSSSSSAAAPSASVAASSSAAAASGAVRRPKDLEASTVSTAASSDDEHAVFVAKQMDPNFTFSRDAAEFVPTPNGSSSASAFQFNPSATEFQPIIPIPQTGFPAGGKGFDGKGSSASDAAAGAPTMALMQPVPMMQSGVYPVMAVAMPGGGGARPPPIAYMSHVGQMGMSGAVSQAAVGYTMSPLGSAPEVGGQSQQPEARGKGASNKGGRRQDAPQWSGKGAGFGRSTDEPQGEWRKGGRSPASASTSWRSRADARANGKGGVGSAIEAEAAEQSKIKTQEAEEEKKDPSKKSWADIARESKAKPVSKPSAASAVAVVTVAASVDASGAGGAAAAAEGAPAAPPLDFQAAAGAAAFPAKPTRSGAERPAAAGEAAAPPGSGGAAPSAAKQSLEAPWRRATAAGAAAKSSRTAAEPTSSSGSAPAAAASRGGSRRASSTEAKLQESQPATEAPPIVWNGPPLAAAVRQLARGGKVGAVSDDSGSANETEQPEKPVAVEDRPEGPSWASRLLKSPGSSPKATATASSQTQQFGIEFAPSAAMAAPAQAEEVIEGGEATHTKAPQPSGGSEAEAGAGGGRTATESEEPLGAGDRQNEDEAQAEEEAGPAKADEDAAQAGNDPEASGATRYSVGFLLKQRQEEPSARATPESAPPTTTSASAAPKEAAATIEEPTPPPMASDDEKTPPPPAPTLASDPAEAAEAAAVEDGEASSGGGGGGGGEGGGGRQSGVANEEDDWRGKTGRQAAGATQDKDSRASGEKGSRKNSVKSWRQDSLKLETSDKSWANIQQSKKSDENQAVTRAMKSILNKLTVEKFDTLYVKLLEVGISTRTHIETLMKEVFEKATTQHHFIEMYTDLCIKLNDWVTERGVVDDDGEKVNFKRILLDQCQDSFETYLKPPKGLAELEGDEQFEAKMKYKTKMLGNMKFVGQLLCNKVVSSKIIQTCCMALIQDTSEETLETLCVFLSVVGPSFDTKEWKNYHVLLDVFHQIKKMCKDSSIPARIRCLLKDVLDLRDSGWVSQRPTNAPEGPKTMAEVKSQWARDNAAKDKKPISGGGGGGSGVGGRGYGGANSPSSATSAGQGEWETVTGGSRRTPSGAGGGSFRGEGGGRGSFGLDEAVSGGRRFSLEDRSSGEARRFKAAPPSPLGRSVSEQFTSGPSTPSRGSQQLAPRSTPKSTQDPERRVSGLDADRPTSTKAKPSLLEQASEEIRLGPSRNMWGKEPVRRASLQRLSAGPSTPSSRSAAAGGDPKAAVPRRSRAELRKEVSSLLRSVVNLSLDEAVASARELKVQADSQEDALQHIISNGAEASESARASIWKLLCRLLVEDIFERGKLVPGVNAFLADTFDELKCDVPKLPSILIEELLPALVESGVLSDDDGARLQSRIRGGGGGGADGEGEAPLR